MGLARPELLLLAVPWIAFWLWFARRQRRSCEWVWRNVHERFRESFTLYRRETLRRRMAWLLILGLLLVVAAAGPAKRGDTEVRELASRVVLLLDGSASMLADDVAAGEGTETRFARGREIALELAQRLEGSRFALVVFSGVAALQLPMTAEPATIEEALGSASYHTFYRSSGSSFTAALDSVLHFVEPGRADLQAVLLSDGEQPFDEPFVEPLAALEEAGVPVHAVAIGSAEGQGRLIYDFRDVVAGKEEKTVLRRFTTRREDRHLKRIARATGGQFSRSDRRAAEEVAEAIEKHIASSRTVRAEGWQDLTRLPLTLFLVGFLLEALVWGRRGRRRDSGFDVANLGSGRSAAAGLALLLAAVLATAACRDNSPLGRASRENERGIAADAIQSWAQARVHYDRSRAFGVQPEIPAFNLARSVTLQEDWSEAHDLYQAALELAPDLAVGHYNDGHVLYRWGEAELDLESCELDRTLDLWNAASRRFAGAAELFAEETSGRQQALENLSFVGQRMAQVEEACAPPVAQQGSASGGAQGQAGGGGAAEGQAGSEGEKEQQSGGGGEEEQQPGGGSDGGEEPGGVGEDEEQQPGTGGEDEGQGAGGEGQQDAGEEGASGEGDNQGAGEEESQDGGAGEEQSDGEGDDPEPAEPGTGDDDGEGQEGDDGADGGGEGEGEDEDEAAGGAEGEGEDEDEGGGAGGGEGGGQGGAGPAPLTAEEMEEIQQALARIAAGRFADGRFHYRSREEQFPREVWENPEAEIWW